VAAAGRGDHQGQAPIAAGEQRLDHTPAVAFGPQLNALGFEPFAEQLQPLLRFWPHPLPLERGVGLGHEGAHPKRQPQPWSGLLQGEQQLGGGLHIGLFLTRQPHHPVELQPGEAAFFGVAGGCIDLLGGELLVHHLAHPFTAAFDGDGERFAAALGQDPAQLWRHRGGSHRAHAHPCALEAVLIEPVQ